MAWWLTFHACICEVEHSRLHSGFSNYSLPTHFNCLSEQGVEGLEGRIGLPVLQLVRCLSRSCMGGEGHRRLVYPYTWSIGCCDTVQYACPIVLPLISGLQTFKHGWHCWAYELGQLAHSAVIFACFYTSSDVV